MPHRWTVACSGLHASGKNPTGLRRRVMMMMEEIFKMGCFNQEIQENPQTEVFF
jgi:hypothetical protein